MKRAGDVLLVIALIVATKALTTDVIRDRESGQHGIALWETVVHRTYEFPDPPGSLELGPELRWASLGLGIAGAAAVLAYLRRRTPVGVCLHICAVLAGGLLDDGLEWECMSFKGPSRFEHDSLAIKLLVSAVTLVMIRTMLTGDKEPERVDPVFE